MRLDKYLKTARILKRRTVSKELADQQRVYVNGKVAKPSTCLLYTSNTCTLSHNSRSMIGSCVPSTMYHSLFGRGLFCFVL